MLYIHFLSINAVQTIKVFIRAQQLQNAKNVEDEDLNQAIVNERCIIDVIRS